MPYKDPEKRKAYLRERRLILKASDPDKLAREEKQKAASFKRKYDRDEAYRKKRSEDHRRWYDNGGKDKVRETQGFKPIEEYLAECDAKRKTHAAYMVEWYKTTQGMRSRVAQTIKKRCGLTIDQYDQVYADQKGCCLICDVHREPYTADRLVVDHCHATGVFRGLLCSRCNTAIGFLDEEPERAERAMLYMQIHCEPHKNKDG